MATPILSHKPILIFNLGFLGVKVAHCSKWSNPFQGSKETAGPAAALSQWNLRASQVQSGGSRGSSSQARRSEGQILTTFTHSQQFFKHRCFSDYPYQFVFCQRQGFPTLPRLASCSPLALASQVAYATTPSSGLADLNWPYPQVCPQHFSLLHSPVYPFWEINDSPNFIYQPPHFYPKLHSRGTRHTWCLAQGLAYMNVSHTNRNLTN